MEHFKQISIKLNRETYQQLLTLQSLTTSTFGVRLTMNNIMLGCIQYSYVNKDKIQEFSDVLKIKILSPEIVEEIEKGKDL